MAEPQPRTANWVLATLITMFGAVMLVATVEGGRADSALLFVVLPTLLAAVLALTPGRTPHGRVFVTTTIALLLIAVALHEGAICVLVAAPLVYAVAHGVTALIRWAGRSRRTGLAILPLPLLLLGGFEGVDQDLRIQPDQSSQVTRVVALTPEQVRARLTAGPQPVAVREPVLRLLQAPAPVHVAGAGLTPGDRWMFGYGATSHGSGGHIVTEVSAAAPGRVVFAVVADSTITSRWLRWRAAEVRWHATADGRTAVTVELAYRRRLDPSWYFGPIQDGLLHEGAGHLLDMLDLR
ncbi:hypothetical protein [Actinoplanes sp. N902-109]|uniref:hypothetical protein n=1 Tax=Actinoplanes sp. (strain N902-109) TaxID=649831 RepID=UPI0003293633|nr:hypothetical protein [Actinoplanes sp. N902-109]AGL17407.1 hypothetical protein L083_3897 [Actinoplanes sp. N902-109]